MVNVVVFTTFWRVTVLVIALVRLPLHATVLLDLILGQSSLGPDVVSHKAELANRKIRDFQDFRSPNRGKSIRNNKIT